MIVIYSQDLWVVFLDLNPIKIDVIICIEMLKKNRINEKKFPIVEKCSETGKYHERYTQTHRVI